MNIDTDRPDGIVPVMERGSGAACREALLDAADKVVARQGIANLTLDAVAKEAGVSKGGLLHHFPAKDRLVEGLVTRAAENWRACFTGAYEKTSEGPGRMSRALLTYCLSDAECWTEQLRTSSSAVFAALAQNPRLIQPMRAVYTDLHVLIAKDGLPPGMGEIVAAAIDGLWLDWVLGLVPLDQARVVRVRLALEGVLRQILADAHTQVGELPHKRPKSIQKKIKKKPVARKVGSQQVFKGSSRAKLRRKEIA